MASVCVALTIQAIRCLRVMIHSFIGAIVIFTKGSFKTGWVVCLCGLTKVTDEMKQVSSDN